MGYDTVLQQTPNSDEIIDDTLLHSRPISDEIIDRMISATKIVF